MVRTNIQLTEAQAKALKEVASRRGRSMAELIREGVDAVIGSSGVSREERIRRAMAASGKFRSGLPDVGTNHDRYLAEAFRR